MSLSKLLCVLCTPLPLSSSTHHSIIRFVLGTVISLARAARHDLSRRHIIIRFVLGLSPRHIIIRFVLGTVISLARAARHDLSSLLHYG